MRKTLILIQANQFSDAQVALLEKLIRNQYRNHVSRERLLVIWNRIPASQAFTNYQDSRSSLVTMECPTGFPQKQRVALLKAIEKDWLKISGQHPDELMLALVEEALFADLFQGTQKRLALRGRIAFMAKIIRTVIHASVKRIPIIVNPNL